jgi:hypothetical protein
MQPVGSCASDAASYRNAGHATKTKLIFSIIITIATSNM